MQFFLIFFSKNKKSKKYEGNKRNAHCLLNANKPIINPKIKISFFEYLNNFLESKRNLYISNAFKKRFVLAKSNFIIFIQIIKVNKNKMLVKTTLVKPYSCRQVSSLPAPEIVNLHNSLTKEGKIQGKGGLKNSQVKFEAG